ncbi:MAG: YitT family protein [Deltaproteobacteria bacterium HGW-Deltaproteobacteria-8]|nr:MAG: YitT family protein [Deltaproteobacteria bacterium HGW-Deltaproteobacteria-8]
MKSSDLSLRQRLRGFVFTVPWNLLLLTAGAALVAFAVKSVAVPHGLLTGGVAGLALLCFYQLPALDAGVWFFLLNVPIMLLGLKMVSRRFVLYSLYGMAATSLLIDHVTYVLPVADPWLAVIACGVTLGAGIGVALRSLGSTGGADILAVIVRERYSMPVGQFEFLFNLLVFALGLAFLKLEVVLYSVAMNFLVSWVVDACLSLFSERRMALVISKQPEGIVQAVLNTLGRGATILDARGGWSGEERKVVLTMLNNLEMKRLEELIYNIDPDAFTIMGSGFHVLGQGFSKRKVY